MRTLTALTMLMLGCFAGCGKKTDAPVTVNGTGSIEMIDSIEFHGLALVDGKNRNLLLDISARPASGQELGLIVQYEFVPEVSEAVPAGVPRKVNFTRFNVIGIQN